MTLTDELSHLLPGRSYLLKWFRHREALQEWPGDGGRWVRRAAKAVASWARQKDAALSPLDRQEASLRQALETELPLADAIRFATALYPQARNWSRELPDDPDHRRALATAWTSWSEHRHAEERDRHDAAALPEFHRALWTRMRKLAEAEEAVRGLLTERDIGWDLEEGDWEDLDFTPLAAAAEILSNEPGIRRIAELLGRDYRARVPLVEPPLVTTETEPEPGRTEIRGVRLGDQMGQLVSSEAALLAYGDTQTLFFKKAAEADLLVWDHFTPAQNAWTSKARERQKHNERGPMIIVLDTSGSMRGKPEEVAKTAVLALLRVALEEERACYLINFSSKTKCVDLSRLREQLPELLRFLGFSFHGGTDLGPALNEALRVLNEGKYRDADVLVVSDFSVPKIPAPVRRGVRDQQDDRGTRFYSLTVSVRPQNDFLNIFDAGWAYNIHPYQTNGIASESLR